MHWTTLSRTQRWTRPTRNRRTGTLKNRLAGHRASRCRAIRSNRHTRLRRLRRGSLVHRPRASLRNNHSRLCRRWSRGLRWSRGSRGCRRAGKCGRWSAGLCLHLVWRTDRRSRGCCRTRRSCNRGCGRYRRRGSGRFHRGSRWYHRRSHHRTGHCLRRNQSRRGRRGRRRFGSRRSGGARGRRSRSGLLGFHRRRHRARWSSWRGGLFLFCNQLEYISRLGDVREVYLGLDFIRLACGSRRTAGCVLRFSGPEMGPHFLRLMIFHGAGVRLFLSDSNLGQHVEDRLALHLELSGQIVDSNLTHPPFPGTAAP